jgi:hypothetical protein
MFTQNIFSFHNVGVIAFFVIVVIGVLILIPFLLEFVYNRTREIVESKVRAHRTIWAWRAFHHYSKVRPPPEGTSVVSDEERIRRSARDLIELAEDYDFVVQIKTVNRTPLAMGNYVMDYEVYPRFRRKENE